MDKRELWRRLKAADPVEPEVIDEWAGSHRAQELLARAQAELRDAPKAGREGLTSGSVRARRPRHWSTRLVAAGLVLAAVGLGIVVGSGILGSGDGVLTAGAPGVPRYAAVRSLESDDLVASRMTRGRQAFRPFEDQSRLGLVHLRTLAFPPGAGAGVLTKAELAEWAWEQLRVLTGAEAAPLVVARPEGMPADVAEAVAGLMAAGVVLSTPAGDTDIDGAATSLDLVRVASLLQRLARETLQE